MTVAQWPAYLLRGVPHDLRTQLSERADTDDVSLADVIRQALCWHYDMDCDYQSFRYQPKLDGGGDVILIRLQPKLWAAMKKETRARYGAFRQLILEALTEYLEDTE
jgi:hypothetical protein